MSGMDHPGIRKLGGGIKKLHRQLKIRSTSLIYDKEIKQWKIEQNIGKPNRQQNV